MDRMMFPPGDFARLLWTLDRAAVVTSVSNDLKEKVNVLLGRDAGVEVIGNVVDTEAFTPGEPNVALREQLGISSDEAVLGSPPNTPTPRRAL